MSTISIVSGNQVEVKWFRAGTSLRPEKNVYAGIYNAAYDIATSKGQPVCFDSSIDHFAMKNDCRLHTFFKYEKFCGVCFIVPSSVPNNDVEVCRWLYNTGEVRLESLPIEAFRVVAAIYSETQSKITFKNFIKFVTERNGNGIHSTAEIEFAYDGRIHQMAQNSWSIASRNVDFEVLKEELSDFLSKQFLDQYEERKLEFLIAARKAASLHVFGKNDLASLIKSFKAVTGYED